MADKFQPLLCTRQEAAQLLKASLRTVDSWIAEGVLPAVRKGRRFVRIRLSDIEKFVA
jgi:excisionase family DNA binding protein